MSGHSKRTHVERELEVSDLRIRNERLVAGLRKYGDHFRDCPRYNLQPLGVDHVCDCGFDAALSPTPSPVFKLG